MLGVIAGLRDVVVAVGNTQNQVGLFSRFDMAGNLAIPRGEAAKVVVEIDAIDPDAGVAINAVEADKYSPIAEFGRDCDGSPARILRIWRKLEALSRELIRHPHTGPCGNVNSRHPKVGRRFYGELPFSGQVDNRVLDAAR